MAAIKTVKSDARPAWRQLAGRCPRDDAGASACEFASGVGASVIFIVPGQAVGGTDDISR